MESLQSRDALEHPKGESLPDDQRVYHPYLGVALNKIPEFIDLLECVGIMGKKFEKFPKE